MQEMDYQREGINMIRFTETMASMPSIVVPEVCCSPAQGHRLPATVTRGAPTSRDGAPISMTCPSQLSIIERDRFA